MGQQQLLLIILGVIVVGIAVAVGITMFKDNAVSANRDAVSISQLTSKPTNANGSYTLTSGSGNGPVILTGTGTEIGNDGTQPVSVVMNVYPDSVVVDAAQTN
jgi:hypothetical protein